MLGLVTSGAPDIYQARQVIGEPVPDPKLRPGIPVPPAVATVTAKV